MMEERMTTALTVEAAIKMWHASRLSVTQTYEMSPEIIKAQDSVIGTLGNFSASIGKAKSKKTFNVSAIVAGGPEEGPGVGGFRQCCGTPPRCRITSVVCYISTPSKALITARR